MINKTKLLFLFNIFAVCCILGIVFFTFTSSNDKDLVRAPFGNEKNAKDLQTEELIMNAFSNMIQHSLTAKKFMPKLIKEMIPEATRLFREAIETNKHFRQKSSLSSKRFDSNETMIFIVGNYGSGTTLMRSIIDVSPKIDCNEESRIVPSVFGLTVHLEEENISRFYKEKLNLATRLFVR